MSIFSFVSGSISPASDLAKRSSQRSSPARSATMRNSAAERSHPTRTHPGRATYIERVDSTILPDAKARLPPLALLLPVVLVRGLVERGGAEQPVRDLTDLQDVLG